jgi:peptide/nickel transport system permease protein/oligopeptide transport system permease protein
MSAASGRLRAFFRALRRHKGAAAALGFLLLIALVATFADLMPFEPFRQRLADALKGPSRTNWFGTDELGRDILARVVYGARTSLTTAAGAVVIAAAVGVPMGLISGFFGGWRDATLMRLVDVMMTLPAILFAMALIAILGRSQIAAIVAVGITGIPSFARITRAQTLALRSRDFVVAVEAFGGSARYNMFRTILPNSWSPILVQVVVLCSVAILLEAALAFLGVGVAPPTPSWGEMLRSGKSYLHEAPYYAVLPGLILTLTILSFDAIGRAMADLLGERYELRKSGSEGAA